MFILEKKCFLLKMSNFFIFILLCSLQIKYSILKLFVYNLDKYCNINYINTKKKCLK